jgi:hypothetical protein
MLEKGRAFERFQRGQREILYLEIS